MADPYFSEIRFFGAASSDFIEIALDNGDDPALVEVVVYHPNGTIRSTNALDPLPDATIAGRDVYTVETGVHKNGAVALVVNGTVVQLLSFHASVTPSEGPASGMPSTQLGTNGNGESFETADQGSSYFVQTNPNSGVIPCFLSGTCVDTPSGPRPVEDLKAGDLVTTFDGPAQKLIWTGTRRLHGVERNDPELRPIRLPAGCLGHNTPSRDVLVSPNHRIYVQDPVLDLLFFAPGVLIEARHLIGWNGISRDLTITDPHYVHLLFDDHQLLNSDGLISESLHPQKRGLQGFSAAARQDLLGLCPELGEREACGQTRCLCLTGRESALALAQLAA